MPGPVTSKKHLYEVLGLTDDASEDAIRVAYKKLVRWHIPRAQDLHKLTSPHFPQALKWHPDRHQDDKQVAQDKFIEVYTLSYIEGYRVLNSFADQGCLHYVAGESKAFTTSQTP